MAMVKIISPCGWDFDTPTASLIKVAHGGLRGHDRSAFIKRAGNTANIFLPFLDKVKFAADEVPVHIIALGSTEKWGANRNGDGFKEACLQKFHDTFVKFARPYRNHKNREPEKSYGVIKLSAYNPVMSRVELLMALNAEKSAAERNGGLVADKELEKLANYGDLGGSMACRVSHDSCSYCGHKSRTRDEYCTPAMCKAGGCKDNLTKMVKVAGDLHHLHVDNPEPTFFDYSYVFRPADRTAYGSKADYLTKVAEDLGAYVGGSAKLAEDLGVLAPMAVLLAQDAPLLGTYERAIADTVKLAHILVRLEEVMQRKPQHYVASKCAFSKEVQPPLDLDVLGLLDSDRVKVAASLGALADQRIVLPLREFARMTKRAQLLEDASPLVPGALCAMVEDGSLEQRLRRNPYAPSAQQEATYKQRVKAACCYSTHSLDKDAVRHRAVLFAVRGGTLPAPIYGFNKRAAASVLARELAADYACYQVAALRRIAEFDKDFYLTGQLALVQNSMG